MRVRCESEEDRDPEVFGDTGRRQGSDIGKPQVECVERAFGDKELVEPMFQLQPVLP